MKVKINKFVLCTDPDSLFYMKIGKIVWFTTDESGIDEVEVEFHGPMKGPWGYDEHTDLIKCDFYDFQNQFKILKFEE